MAEKGKIRESEIIEKAVYEIGQKIATSLVPAQKEVDNLKIIWVKSLNEMKAAALEFQTLQSQFKVSEGYKAFIETKNKQLSASEKAQKAIQREKNITEQLIVAYQQQERAEKQLITTIERKKLATEATAKALAKEQYELQNLNKRAKEAAILSSKLSTEYEKQSVRLEQLKRKYKDLALTQGENSREAKLLRAEILRLDSTLKKVDASVGEFRRNVGNYGSALRSAAAAARSLMSAMGLTSGAYLFVAVMRDAIKTVVEFDRQLIAVQKTTSMTDKEIKEFGQRVIDLGLSLEGISTQGLLKASEIAGQLGIRGSENILRFSETIEKLKLTSDIIGEDSVRNFAQFIELSRDSVKNVDRLGSVITELGNNFATTERRILSNSTEIQKGLSIYNASAESILGLGAATSALGSKAEVSRGAMQSVFKVLNDGASTGANLEKILKLTGQTAEEFRKEFNTNAVETFRKFIKGLSDSAKQGKNLSNMLVDLGIDEKRTTAVTGALALNYETLEEALKRATDEYQNNVALNKESGKAAESLSSKIGDLGDAWDNLILSIERGEGPISKAFKGFVEGITDIVQGISRTEKAIADVERITGKTSLSSPFLGIMSQIDEEQIALNARLQEFSKSTSKIKDMQLELLQVQEWIRKARNGEIRVMEGTTKLWAQYARELAKIAKAKAEEASATEKSNKETEENTDFTYDNSAAEKENEKAKKAAAKAAREKERELRKQQKAEEDLNRALRERMKLSETSTYNKNKSGLEFELEEQKKILENEEASLQERIVANQKYIDTKNEIAELEKEHETRVIQDTLKEKLASDLKLISSEKEKGKIISDYDKTYKDQMVAVDNGYNKKIIDNAEEKKDNAIKILKTQFEKELELIKQAKQDQEYAMSKELASAQNDFLNSGQTRKDVEVFEKRNYEIKQKYAKLEIQSQIDKIKEILKADESADESRKFSAKQRQQLESTLKDLQKDYSKEVTDQIIDDIDKQLDAYEKLQDFKRNLYSGLSDGIAEALDIDSSPVTDFFTSFDTLISNSSKTFNDFFGENFKENMIDVLQTLSAAAEVSRNVIASVYAANIEELEYQKDELSDYYDKQYELAEGDKEQQDLIREEQKKKEDELNKQIKKEKTEAAKADKAAAIVQAQINTALAITSALTQAPPGSYVMAAISAAMGIAQTLLIASKPIPKFKKGVENFGGGLAILGDGGVSEIVETPDGKISKTPNKDTLYDLPKGTNVYKSEQDYRDIMRASILANVEMSNNKYKKYNETEIFDKHYNAINEKKIEEAIKNGFKNQKVNFHTNTTVDMSYHLWRIKQLQ